MEKEMKLKTLKDTGFFTEGETKVLKREAIKWWKSIEKGNVENEDCQGFIKHFFNLSEEDLNLLKRLGHYD